MDEPHIKGQFPSLEKTTHNRVLIETSKKANEIAIRWGTSKQEVYRWLVELAYYEGVHPYPELLKEKKKEESSNKSDVE